METAPTSIEVLLRPTRSQSDEPSDLRGSLSPMSVYNTWQSQAVTPPIMNRAQRCLTSVIEHKPLTLTLSKACLFPLSISYLLDIDNRIYYL